MGNVKELVKAFLVWKLIGEKIFKAIVSSIRNVWSVIRGAIVKVAKLARGAFNLAWKALPKRARAKAKSRCNMTSPRCSIDGLFRPTAALQSANNRYSSL